MAKPKGWVKEPVRHGLAAKGIKTVKGTREHPMAWFRNPGTGEVSFLPPGVAKREGYTTGPYISHNAALVMGELRERGQKESFSQARRKKFGNRMAEWGFSIRQTQPFVLLRQELPEADVEISLTTDGSLVYTEWIGNRTIRTEKAKVLSIEQAELQALNWFGK